jgi:transposase InsO family protein
MKDYRKIFPVERMCIVFGVSNSGFYYWLKNPKGKRLIDDTNLMIEISRVYAESKGCYGSPRITAELCANGIFVSRPRVARLMRRLGIKSTIRKKWVQTTDSKHTYALAENLLDRDFYAINIGEKWVSDLTYIQTGEGWLYLTTVIDLADRKVIGWSLSETMEAKNTTVKALEMAIKNRPITPQLIFHSDRGVQYACSEFRKQLAYLRIRQSMSRKGNCWDNAVAESFFKTIKTEMIYQNVYKTRAKASLAIFEYIEVWYNRKRRHSYLGYLSPLEFENKSIIPKIAA